MLTLTETIAAINSLDTDPDVIANACMSVLFPAPPVAGDTEVITRTAIDLVKRYGNLGPTDLLDALSIAMSAVAAASCKPGHEIRLVGALYETLRSNFADAIAKRLKEVYMNDPEEGKRRIAMLLTQHQ